MKDFLTYLKETEEVGYISQVINFLIEIEGLPSARLNELVVFETGEIGRITTIAHKSVEVITFSKSSLKVGTRVTRTNEFLMVGVGAGLLGKTMDPLGVSLDPQNPIGKMDETREIDVTPGGIDTRSRITKPLETGATLVDLIIPLGMGQRELVIGDRKTGKTSFLIQAILTQAKRGTICVYAAIGKKTLDIKKIEELFQKSGIAKNTVIVASSSQDPVGVIYLTPYTAMTVAEYFRDLGRDVLVVLDDLSTHAKFYREISLLGKRFPGRNSYPGDIFYIHAKLLERAGNFKTAKGPVSITCLPVTEAVQGDLTGYIQTNLMSMTDGHIYFDNDLFSKGKRPAVNTFLSVTRVGRQTQTILRRDINRELVSFLTLYDKMQRFVHFGAELSETVKQTLATGEKIEMFFKQSSYQTMEPNLQIFLFSLLWIGAWQDKKNDQMLSEMRKIEDLYNANEKNRTEVIASLSQAQSFNGYLNILRKDLSGVLDRMLGRAKPLVPVVKPAAPVATAQQPQTQPATQAASTNQSQKQ